MLRRLMVSLLALTLLPWTSPAQAITYSDTINSVVQILSIGATEEDSVIGSGFFMSIDGLVLTNAHVVLNETTGEPYEEIYICVIEDEYSSPICAFLASVLAYDADIDLAILQPNYLIDENWAITGEALSSEDMMALEPPYVDFADVIPSLGETVNILGFPAGSGVGSINLTEGVVSGFIPLIDDWNWIFTTDAIINPGNSGGPAYNEDERVVGVATAITTDTPGGAYGYVTSVDAILLWFLSLADAGILNEVFVEEAFSNDFVEEAEASGDSIEDAQIFSDVTLDTPNAEAIAYLKEQGVLGGYPDGSFKPTQSLNRAELLKILVEGKGITPDSSYTNCFPDVKNEWFAKYVCYAKEQGWISGYPDGTFRPSSNVNKVEAIKMLLEVFDVDTTANPANGPFSDVPLGAWFTNYIHVAKQLGLLEESGNNYFPSTEITRGGISENIYRLLLTQ
jgi:S1-C subfamily serine protease